MEDLKKQAEQTIKRPLGSSTIHPPWSKAGSEDGAAFNVAIFTSDVVDELAKAGKSTRNAHGDRPAADRPGKSRRRAKPDIKTSAALKKTCLRPSR